MLAFSYFVAISGDPFLEGDKMKLAIILEIYKSICYPSASNSHFLAPFLIPFFQQKEPTQPT